jgi:hypothetical protein
MNDSLRLGCSKQCGDGCGKRLQKFTTVHCFPPALTS